MPQKTMDAKFTSLKELLKKRQLAAEKDGIVLSERHYLMYPLDPGSAHNRTKKREVRNSHLVIKSDYS